jgi:steroid 5-alpha reductase family enzyme
MTLLAFVGVAAAQAVAMSAIMTLAWVVQQRTGNSGWIDAVWTFGLGAVGVVSALALLSPGDWPTVRQIVVALLTALWSLRLGLHLVQRSASRPDDPRYGELMRQWGMDARREMFGLLQKQALVSIPLAISLFVAAQNSAPGLRVTDGIAVILIAFSIAGEARADAELRAFSRDPRNAGRVCDAGLWSYSRHPNYFFEWLFWLAFPLLAISAGYPFGWAALSGPVCMYWLLRHVSGIPPLEDHMTRRYGAAYRAYQSRTSVFFPWQRTAS